MKKEIELEITNLYGSGQFPREVKTSKSKVKRTKVRTTTRADIDIPQRSETAEETSEEVREKVHSFKYENGNPIVRLGGAYGKIPGLLKQAGLVLATANEDISKTSIYIMMQAVQIFPEWCELELDGGELQIEEGLTTTFGFKGGKATQKPTTWDIIPKCRTKITMIYPDAFDGRMKEIMPIAEQLNFGERRRGRLKVISGFY